MIMRASTYPDKGKDLPENRQRQYQQLYLVIIVGPD